MKEAPGGNGGRERRAKECADWRASTALIEKMGGQALLAREVNVSRAQGKLGSLTLARAKEWVEVKAMCPCVVLVISAAGQWLRWR
jgi:hypothetical protein